MIFYSKMEKVKGEKYSRQLIPFKWMHTFFQMRRCLYVVAFKKKKQKQKNRCVQVYNNTGKQKQDKTHLRNFAI